MTKVENTHVTFRPSVNSNMLIGTAACAVISYLAFSIALIYDMTHFLGIFAFKIPVKKETMNQVKKKI